MMLKSTGERGHLFYIPNLSGEVWSFSPFIMLVKVFCKVKQMMLSHVRLFATPWTVAYHVPPSMGFSRQEYWSGFPFPSPEDLPDPGIEPESPAVLADALPSEPPGKSYKTEDVIY